MGTLEAKCEDLAKLVKIQPKLLDLEACTRRLNIKIVGIKQCSEDRESERVYFQPHPRIIG